MGGGEFERDQFWADFVVGNFACFVVDTAAAAVADLDTAVVDLDTAVAADLDMADLDTAVAADLDTDAAVEVEEQDDHLEDHNCLDRAAWVVQHCCGLVLVLVQDILYKKGVAVGQEAQVVAAAVEGIAARL